MKPDQAEFEKSPYAKLTQPAVVRVGYNESGKAKEKINREIRMGNDVIVVVRYGNFHKVKNNNGYRGYSWHAIKNFDMLTGTQ